MLNKDLLQICVAVFAAVLAASITTYLSIRTRKNEWITILRNEVAGFMAATSNPKDTYTYLKHRAAVELLLNPKKKEQQDLIESVSAMSIALEAMQMEVGNLNRERYNNAHKLFNESSALAITQFRIVVKRKMSTWFYRSVYTRIVKPKTVKDMM
ncbi:MAG: hypothetical protein BGO69_15750 [Bacteroidetes bacterium 46-16]|nr:MAG: hypothetical protein BGO69_15750 [Bacteroidetes bacterium 46-16]